MDLKPLILDFTLFKRIVKESFRGKTLARIFLNHALAQMSVTGKILDLGSSTESASYHRFLKYVQPFEIIHTDFYHDAPGIVKLDLEKPFLIPDGSYDAITCFNTLEHIYNYKGLMFESFRVMKPGGVFVGGVPFLVNYHADPHDYFRYTHEAIHRICEEAGFSVQNITSLGAGPCTIAAEFFNRILPVWLHCFLALPAVIIDFCLIRLKPSISCRFALGYMFSCKK